MKLEISVPEAVRIFKEIQEQPDQPYEMIKFDITKGIGQYLSRSMHTELTHFLGKKFLIYNPNPPYVCTLTGIDRIG